ncbi:UDP-glucose/GDP-mannose dehydrogenase family protein [Candidatus Woesearchaeota archaeon]|nr:UDP-glucose/GDP-mannose dehydrogenase family protein [Candidatus Woesearchaeota archaeon]
MKIAVIGMGYVGGTTAACFAELGHEVWGIDHDAKKIQLYKTGKAPFYEKGLDRLIKHNSSEGRLNFTTNISEGIKEAKVIIIAVGTPPKEDGSPDLSAMEKVAQEIGESLDHYAVIVEKSTVPIRTGEWMNKILGKHLSKERFDIAACPEFLQESTAVSDFMKPDRIVIGADSEKASPILFELYKPIVAPKIHTSIKAAEMIKHAVNAALYTKIAFAFSVSQLCDAEGNVDCIEVLRGVGLDKRVGEAFLQPGPGVGGFCFPKDLDALIAIQKQFRVYPGLFEAVREINKLQKNHVVNKVIKSFDGDISNQIIGVLGLAFKAGTNDMRLAASIDIIKELQKKGATIVAYDPKAMDEAKQIFTNIEYANSSEEVAEKSNALLILTEWPEFQELDMKKIREKLKIVIDTRNLFEPKRMKQLGYIYYCMGRPI